MEKKIISQQILDTSFKKSSVQSVYPQAKSDSLLVESVFSALSDHMSLSMFNIIAIMSSDPASDTGKPAKKILISSLNLTRRQYYSRISQLRDAGLITKRRTGFVLTSLGKVVHETHKAIGIAVQNRWKLQAIDLLETSVPTDIMPTDGKHKVINMLLGDCQQIRDILLRHCDAKN